MESKIERLKALMESSQPSLRLQFGVSLRKRTSSNPKQYGCERVSEVLDLGFIYNDNYTPKTYPNVF